MPGCPDDLHDYTNRVAPRRASRRSREDDGPIVVTDDWPEQVPIGDTDDRRPAFQAMIDAAMVKPPTFTVIVVHSFSRFFRDQFQFEFYVRKLAKNGVKLVSITQDLGDDPMSAMMR